MSGYYTVDSIDPVPAARAEGGTDPYDDTPAGVPVALAVEIDAALPIVWLLAHRAEWQGRRAA